MDFETYERRLRALHVQVGRGFLTPDEAFMEAHEIAAEFWIQAMTPVEVPA